VSRGRLLVNDNVLPFTGVQIVRDTDPRDLEIVTLQRALADEKLLREIYQEIATERLQTLIYIRSKIDDFQAQRNTKANGRPRL
jgi:hypothetical protein